MNAVFYFILAGMLTAYAVLDGFDLGAGIVHFLVGRTDLERRTVLAAIGPFWDGNEVWLLASGGVLVFAFPKAYAAAFSGLYMPLMMVLWLLVLRGLAVELRAKVEHPLWHSGWDAVFAASSAILALVLGVALANVMRGVPLQRSGYFELDLFAGPRGARAAALDSFTSLIGAFAVAALGAHGATFLAWKTRGDLGVRSAFAARILWVGVLALGLAATVVLALFERPFFAAFMARPWLWPLPVAAAAAAAASRRLVRGPHELAAFLASSAFIGLMLLATAGVLYPVILRSTVNEALSLDAYNAATAPASLRLGVLLWAPAVLLATGYFGYLFRSFRGKSDPAASHYGQ